jgi:hypothetical protein
MLTFGQFKQGPAARSTGVAVDSDDFRNYTNEAVRMVLRRGNWWSTVQPIQGCTYNGCITWPRYVASVLAMDMAFKNVNVQNRWFGFINWTANMCTYVSQRGGTGKMWPVEAFEGTSPVFQNVPRGQSMFLQVFISNQADIGKTITFYGTDSNQQVIRSKRPDGTIQDGIQLVLKNPMVESPIRITHVDRVVKDVTADTIRVYQWDGTTLNPDTTPNLIDMARYEPGETTPEYNVSKAVPGCQNGGNVTALVKLAYIPVRFDNDLILVDNEEALATMIQAIRYRENGDEVRKRLFEVDAFRELNYQLKERFPMEQTPFHLNLFGDNSRITSRQ